MGIVFVLVVVLAGAALLTAFISSRMVLRRSPGEGKMIEMSRAIQEGADAFVKEEGKKIAIIAVIIALILGIVFHFRYSFAFLFGAFMSELAGVIGMRMSTRTNVRVTNSARKGPLDAFRTAFTGGTVMGMSVSGLSILGLVIVMWIYKSAFMFNNVVLVHKFHIAFVDGVMLVSSYSFGASMIALFDRVGGGIYTKAADMGADLVGKVEAKIPEDDPRNPATIADNVGDNVGDVAGLGADIFESYVASIIASIVLAIYMKLGDTSMSAHNYTSMIMYPLLIGASGIAASILGIIFVRSLKVKDGRTALMAGNFFTGGLTLLFVFFATWYVKINYFGNIFNIYISVISGLIAGIAISKLCEYYTSDRYKPVKILAEKTQSGAAINVTSGLSLGMRSVLLPVLVIFTAILVAYAAGNVYGISIAALGMLSFVGYIVSVDTFGPISDNAGGIAQMAELDPRVREITDRLDAAGNTTAAIGKGFAIGSASFAALSLIVSFILSSAQTVEGIRSLLGAMAGNDVVHLQQAFNFTSLVNPYVLVGLLIGAALPYFFSSLLIDGVASTAFLMVEEIRRQFKNDPGILEGKSKPDYTRCITISAKGALKKMFLPGAIALLTPFIVGWTLGKGAISGLLMGGLLSAIVIAIYTANAGGALDNAKKYIESGHFGGKGTDTHAASVVGDTVGDPLKDTVGPSMDILIKMMSVISLLFGSIFLTHPFFT